MPRAHRDPPPAELVRLGHALRTLRHRQALKQIEVATAAGLTESQVSDLERAQINAGWLLVVRLVEYGLGLTLRDLADAYEDATGSA